MILLIEKAKSGDKDAFNKLIPIIQRKLYFVAKSKIFNEEDVKDVIQITLTKAYKNINNLKDNNKFVCWITNILINTCNTFLKKNISEESLSYGDSQLDNFSLEEDIYIEVDDDIDFYTMIEDLYEEERILLSMYYSDEYTTKEISEILKINESTIRSKISRAKIKIAKKYEKEV